MSQIIFRFKTTGINTSQPSNDVLQTIPSKLFLICEETFFCENILNAKLIPDVLKCVKEIITDQECSSDELNVIIQSYNFTIFRFLIEVLITTILRIKVDIKDEAAYCISVLNHTIWNDYLQNNIERISPFLLITNESIDRLYKIIYAPKLEIKESTIYSGFDTRDIKDYNINVNADELNQIQQIHKDQKEKLRIITQSRIIILNSQYNSGWMIPYVQMYMKLNRSKGSEGGQSETAVVPPIHYGETPTYDIIKILVDFGVYIIGMMKHVDEEDYFQCIRLIIGLSHQFPVQVETILNTTVTFTEISQVFYRMELRNEVGMNVSQGLLHLLNDGSVDQSDQIIALCQFIVHTIDASVHYHYQEAMKRLSKHRKDVKEMDPLLTWDAMRSTYFYTNDIKVMIEIIRRELMNLPVDRDDKVNQGSIESIRITYLRLLDCIITKTNWSTATDNYQKDLIMKDLERIVSSEEETAEKAIALEIFMKLQIK